MAASASSTARSIELASPGGLLRDYALAHLGKSFFWTAGDALTIFFLTRHAGYTPATAGAIFLAALFWNALCDVLVGLWADRCTAAGRSLVPALALATPLICAGFLASLLLPNRYFALTLAASFLFRTAFSIFDVPHNAMMARLSTTPARGVRVANLRIVAAGVASFVVGLAAMPMLDRRLELAPEYFVPALAVIAMLLMLPFVRSLAWCEALPSAAAPGEDRAIDLRACSFWRLCVVTAVGTVASAALGKVLLHLDMGGSVWSAGVLLALMGGRIASAVLAGPLLARHGTRTLRIAYAAATLPILVLPIALRIDGVLVLATILVLGIAFGIVTTVSWVLLAAQVRAFAQSDRCGALRCGTYTMITKAAIGAGGWLLGAFLARSEVAPGSALMDMPMLGALCGVAAAGTALAAWLSLRRVS